jgi:hypothetical protein
MEPVSEALFGKRLTIFGDDENEVVCRHGIYCRLQLRKNQQSTNVLIRLLLYERNFVRDLVRAYHYRLVEPSNMLATNPNNIAAAQASAG